MSIRIAEAFRKLALIVAVSGLAMLPASLHASVIPLAGGAVLTVTNASALLGLSNACVNWNSAATCTLPPTSVQDAVSGQDAAVFTVGSTPLDTVKDLPAGFTEPLVDFQTAQSPLPGGVVHFDLISLVIPAVPAGNNCTTFALGAVCTPQGGSPFTITQESANQLAVEFKVNEEAYTGTSGVNYNAATPYIADFSFQLAGTLPNGNTDTIPNLLTFIAGGGTITTTWSATVISVGAVPEPVSVFLFGSGLFGVAVLARKLRRTL